MHEFQYIMRLLLFVLAIGATVIGCNAKVNQSDKQTSPAASGLDGVKVESKSIRIGTPSQ